MSPSFSDNPFEAPAFLEGLEAAGYLQRLDTSEARITARYQHALTKMKFASHSEAFLTRMGVRKVHGSTVQFFNETPVSDPFVHILVGKLPRGRPTQELVTPPGCSTSGWTPIGSPDEADGTVHYTVSHSGFWPVTVVLDENPSPERLAAEDQFSEVDDDLPPRRSGSRRNTGSRYGSIYDTEEDDNDDLGLDRRASRRGSRADSYRSSASRRRPSYAADDDDDEDDYEYGRSTSRRASSRSNSRRNSRF